MKLNTTQKDALQKLFQAGFRRSSEMLNYITESPITLQLSPLTILSPQQLAEQLEPSLGQEQIVAMELTFSGEFQGTAQIIFPRDSAASLVNIIANEERRKLDQNSLRRETLSEVGNILFNGIMGAISTVVDRGITYMMPAYREGTVQQLLSVPNSNLYQISLLGEVQFKIKRIDNAGTKQLHSFSQVLSPKYLNLFFEKFRTGKNILFFLEVDTLDTLLHKIKNASDYFTES